MAHEEYFPERADDYGPELRAFIEGGRSKSGPAYARARQAQAAFARELEELFDEIDLLLCPALAVPMPAETATTHPMTLDMGTTVVRFTLPFDVTGSPTLTLPCGYRGGRTPIGLQLVARPLEEDLLVRAGDAFQRETDWQRQHPTI